MGAVSLGLNPGSLAMSNLSMLLSAFIFSFLSSYLVSSLVGEFDSSFFFKLLRIEDSNLYKITQLVSSKSKILSSLFPIPCYNYYVIVMSLFHLIITNLLVWYY